MGNHRQSNERALEGAHMTSQGRLLMSQRQRIVELEAKCRWAADEMQSVADAITSNYTARAHAIALSCAAQMEEISNA